MREIQLYGKLAAGKTALVDDDMYDFLNQFRWSADAQGYAASSQRIYKMHRLIMNAQKGELVDHINRDKLDNRKCNLRIVDKSLNALNKPIRAGKSGFKGVSRAGSITEKWRAHIGTNDPTI